MAKGHRLVWLAVALAVFGAVACGNSSGAKTATATTKPIEAQGGLATTTTGVGGAPTTTIGPRKEPTGKVVYGWHTALTPAWLDPQDSGNVITAYGFMYAVHDSMIKNFPGQNFAPSLAESYKVADDFKSASFVIRASAKFHDGSPVTSDDVEFTYMNYRGTQNKLFKDKLDRIEKKDAKNITFYFKEPFVDFLVLYATPATGIGWIVPKAYYTQVGPDGPAIETYSPFLISRSTSDRACVSISSV